MITKIKSIKKKENYIVIYFDYFDQENFTYLSKRSLLYWKNVRKIESIKVGDSINVFKVQNTDNFKIVSINNK